MSVSAQAGTVRCDGCEFQFDPAAIRRRPAPLWRKVLGLALLAAGGMLLLSSLLATFRLLGDGGQRSPVEARRLPLQIAGAFLLPAGCLLAGARLVRSRTDVAATVAEADPPGPR